MAKKNSKQEVKKKVVTFDTGFIEQTEKGLSSETEESNVEKVEDIKDVKESSKKPNTPKASDKPSKTSVDDYHIVRMKLPVDQIEAYTALCMEFQQEVKSFAFSNPSHYFQAFVDYLVQKYKRQSNYHIAPEEFLSHIKRKGLRPNTPDQGEKEVMYLRPTNEHYEKYVNLIYSFLYKADDVFNPLYSLTFFFNDFLGMIKKDIAKVSAMYKAK
ncbi:MAG: hypothetical protein AAGA43_15835 [Bacteroidota bacterium]